MREGLYFLFCTSKSFLSVPCHVAESDGDVCVCLEKDQEGLGVYSMCHGVLKF